ncbi:MAG: hypothetical protein ACREX3_03420, partial [Gammaproteobacteria bacterium]
TRLFKKVELQGTRQTDERRRTYAVRWSEAVERNEVDGPFSTAWVGFDLGDPKSARGPTEIVTHRLSLSEMVRILCLTHENHHVIGKRNFTTPFSADYSCVIGRKELSYHPVMVIVVSLRPRHISTS